MADRFEIDEEWLGRLVRVLVVFRAFVLLVTIIVLPSQQQTPVVAVAVLLAAVLSYLTLTRWRQIGRSVSRNPLYLAVEVLLSTLILAAAGARSPLFYFTLGTAALAGVVYGRRGAMAFSALLIAAYELIALYGLPHLHPLHDAHSVLFVPLLYPAAVAAGVAARELIQRGVQAEALLRERTEALSAERERLRVARELHDSLAKTVEGLAMTASVLPGRLTRNPTAASELARQLGADARQAAIEARALMSDLRPASGDQVALHEAIRTHLEGLAQRAGIAVSVVCDPDWAQRALPAPTTHELLRITGEALANAAKHGGARRVEVTLGGDHEALVLRIGDDGSGLDQPIELASLQSGGHFGLAGMHERAHAIGGALSVETAKPGGTVVTVRVPLDDSSSHVTAAPAPGRPRWLAWRHRGGAASATAITRLKSP